MIAICSPSRFTPSMPEPVSMMVAAWVSWVLVSVNSSPSRVRTVSSSGTSPTVKPPPGTVQVEVRAGFISSPIPTIDNNGAASTSASSTIASFFTTTTPPSSGSAQGVVELGQPQQMTGVVGGLADHEHGERHLVLGRDRLVVPHPGAVADALDRDRWRALGDLPGLGLRLGGRPRLGHERIGDLQVLGGGVLAQIDPRLADRQVGGEVIGEAGLLGAGGVGDLHH